MSKVICDVCGTSYPETATQCPICGCVRPADAAPVNEAETDEGGYTYVKGGRFSKSNVRKRNLGVATPKVAPKTPSKEKKPVNKKLIGFIIVLACLVLILVLLAVYLYPLLKPKDEPKNDPVTEQTVIACEDIKLSMLSFVITEADQVLNLSVTCSPLNTTDKVTFSSSDESVISVDEKGNITYVANGKADVIVKCGSIEERCKITCEVPVVDEPTQPEPTGETTAPVEIRFLTTLIQTSDYFQCDPGTQYTLCVVDETLVNEIKWSSDDPGVAEFRDGVVYMIADGTTTVRAKYGDQELSCTVIVGTGDGYNHLPPDIDIDLSQYSGWCQTAYGGWIPPDCKQLLTDEGRKSPYIDASFSSGDYDVSYQFGILPVGTSDAIILKWRPLDENDVGCFDIENNTFVPNEEFSGRTVYWAQHGDEKIYLYVTVN